MSDTTAEATVADGEATAVAPQIPVGDGVVMSARERLIAEALKVYGGGAGEFSSPTLPLAPLPSCLSPIRAVCPVRRWDGRGSTCLTPNATHALQMRQGKQTPEMKRLEEVQVRECPHHPSCTCILYTMQSILAHATHHQPYSVLDLTPSTDRPLTPPAAIRHTSAAAEPAAAVAKPKAARNVSS
jgi:hypothetical protein